jgi:hypothetical protein
MGMRRHKRAVIASPCGVLEAGAEPSIDGGRLYLQCPKLQWHLAISQFYSHAMLKSTIFA